MWKIILQITGKKTEYGLQKLSLKVLALGANGYLDDMLACTFLKENM